MQLYTVILISLYSGYGGALPPGIISVSSLHKQTFLFGHKTDLMITRPYIYSVRGIAQAVLAAELLLSLVVNLLYELFFGDLKESSSRFFGKPLKNLLAIRMGNQN
jgi:hypothetical protein